MGFADNFVFNGESPTRVNADLTISKTDPAVVLAAQETNGLYSVLREINGTQWLMQNADYSTTTGFYQVVSTSPSYAFAQLSGGGLASYTVPAGTPAGFTWTRQFYVDNTGTLQSPVNGSTLIQPGSITAADLATGAAQGNISAGTLTASQLATGAALSNIGAGTITSTYLAANAALNNITTRSIGSSQIAYANNLTQLGWYSVKDFGAVGNGTTDDSLAIQNAHAAASAAHGCVYYPPTNGGTYYYNSATPININNEQVFATPGILIQGGSATTDCFYLKGSPGTFYLPSINGFTNGCGVRIPNSLCVVYVQSINNCKTGVRLEGNGNIGQNCLDNTVTVNNIGLCSLAGVSMYFTNCNEVFQGNIVNINFVDACLYGLYFQDGGGTATGSNTFNTATNIMNLYAVDGTSVTGSKAIYCDSRPVPFGMIVNMSVFYGGFSGTPWMTWNGGFANTLIVPGGGAGAAPQAFANYAVSNFTRENIIGNITQTTQPSNGNNYFTASTTANNRTGFSTTLNPSLGSGNGPGANTFTVFMTTTSALAAGGQATFYVYSPYTTGDSNLISIRSSGTAPIVYSATDNSQTNANEIKITLTAVGALAAGSYQAVIRVGIP